MMTMWKCASNCFLSTIHKGLFKKGSAILSAKAIHPVTNNALFKLSPILLERFSRYHGYCKENSSKFSKGRKRRKNPNEKKFSFLGGFDHNMFDALTWSGVFAIGYYLLQPFTQKQWRHAYKNGNCLTESGCKTTFNYFFNVFGLRPVNYVLPEVKAAKTVPKCHPASENLQECKQETDTFEKAHEKVSGFLSNWMGIRHMQSGQHAEALKFFIDSADKQNPAGVFNLGICHEKGLGTGQNFQRAAELYQRATDMGHAKAMYNLGVFYARGLGVDEVDVNKARELFTAAARLGQKDAERALKAEFPLASEDNSVENDFENVISRLLSYTTVVESSALDDEEICCKDIFCDNDSGVLDLSPRLEPDELYI